MYLMPLWHSVEQIISPWYVSSILFGEMSFLFSTACSYLYRHPKICTYNVHAHTPERLLQSMHFCQIQLVCFPFAACQSFDIATHWDKLADIFCDTKTLKVGISAGVHNLSKFMQIRLPKGEMTIHIMSVHKNNLAS